MNLLSNRKALAVALSFAAVGAGAMIVACSGSSGGNGAGNTNPDGSTTNPDGGVSTQPGSCANPTIPIYFSPMYSAYIAGSSMQQFLIPAVTGDGNMATWSLSDPSQANLQAQTFSTDADGGGTALPGVMITLAGSGAGASATTPGTVTVYATESGGACGSAVLNITQNTENDWTIGNARYNDGDNLHIGPPAGYDGGKFMRPDGGFPEGGMGMGGGGFGLTDGGSPFETDGGTACTTCHGPTATNFLFKDVQHTPEQTGGFSDNDLQNIILMGMVPDGGYFDPSVLDGYMSQITHAKVNCDDAGTILSPDAPACLTAAYTAWQGFHQWSDITSDEIPGVICYLRALPPSAQTGSSNFGGGGKGRPDGGFGRPDGGGKGPVDSGGGSDDGGSVDSGQGD